MKENERKNVVKCKKLSLKWRILGGCKDENRLYLCKK